MGSTNLCPRLATKNHFIDCLRRAVAGAYVLDYVQHSLHLLLAPLHLVSQKRHSSSVARNNPSAFPAELNDCDRLLLLRSSIPHCLGY